MVGNASKYISQTRCTNILEAIDQADLTESVEKDTALAKAVSITKKQKKENNYSTQEVTQLRDDQFSRRAPPARYKGRQDKNATPYNQYHHTDSADTDQMRCHQYT